MRDYLTIKDIYGERSDAPSLRRPFTRSRQVVPATASFRFAQPHELETGGDDDFSTFFHCHASLTVGRDAVAILAKHQSRVTPLTSGECPCPNTSSCMYERGV